MTHLSLKIKRLRELRNNSQDYLALCLNISQQTYSRLERGSGKLTIERLQKIAEVLEFDLAQLISLPLQAFDNGIPETSSQDVVRPSFKINSKTEVKLAKIEQEIHQIKLQLPLLFSVSTGGASTTNNVDLVG